MAIGYTRQSSGFIVNENGIEASHFNNEFNLLESAFDAATGHNHDGTAGGGAKVDLVNSITGTLPVTNGGTGATTASAARTSLGLVIGTDVQAFDAGLASISGLTTTADQMIYLTAADTYATTAFSAFGRSFVDDADAAAGRTTLGVVIGTDVQAQNANLQSIAGLTLAADQMLYATGANTVTTTTFTPLARNLMDDADQATMRSTIGVAVGTDVQAFDADLQALAGLTTAADRLPYFTGLNSAALATFTAFGRSLVDDADNAAARTTLGLVIGTDVQAFDAGLQSIAGLTTAADQMIYATGADTYAVTGLTAAGRALNSAADNVAQRAALGLGSAAVENTSAFEPALPSGFIGMTAAAVAPSGWLLCDGAAVSRTTYADLFTAIGTTYGVGDGATTFNLPDSQGRGAIGAGTGVGLTARSRGDTGGSETHALTEAELAPHTHQVTLSPTSEGAENSGRVVTGNNASGSSLGPYTTTSAGSGEAHENMPPFAVFNFIIKI